MKMAPCAPGAAGATGVKLPALMTVGRRAVARYCQEDGG